MEAEKKAPPTMEDRVRILLQYWGQPFNTTKEMSLRGKYVLMGAARNSMTGQLFLLNQTGIKFFADECFIELKPLSKISDEDAQRVAILAASGITIPEDRLAHWGRELLAGYLRKQSNVYGRDWWAVLDFLRSRGYALPYGPWSVDELVQFGIFKLEE